MDQLHLSSCLSNCLFTLSRDLYSDGPNLVYPREFLGLISTYKRTEPRTMDGEARYQAR